MRERVAPASPRPDEIVDVRAPLDAMRLVKDEHELALMRRAARFPAPRIGARWHDARPGWFEYQVEAELLHEFLRDGAQAVGLSARSSPAGPTPACCTIARTTAQMNDGDLLLIDAGCEFQGYASDITRTFPVNGKFSGPQKDVYELVLAAQQACIDAVKPGAAFHAYHDGGRARAGAGLHRSRARARARSTR